ncbi:hypothetical protein Q5H92_21755 [Hymenobacter sp. M29]|uniref:Uncharacterized protein n=1 Tax=Hymenobacter mellowenesis TaxID=3063995 RepID=A0ABT9AIR2_9BACT|nr:hypothetical protein [Hymenobacter sp. M29]MDO7849005.1 hypothetical protein [Hymenobacter sp. M29]
MRYAEQAALKQLEQVTNIADADAQPVDARLLELGESITGQKGRIGTRMQNRNNALRLDAVEPLLNTLQQAVGLLITKSDAQDARLTDLGAQSDLLRANATATRSALEANTAADAALRAYEESNAARLLLLEARVSKDEGAITAAQAKADAAQASATTAIANAATAQAAANANTAELVRLAADVAKRLPADLVQRFSISTPGVTIQALTPATFPVPLPKPFADGNYFVFFTKASGAALLNVQLSDTAKTATGFTATMQQTGLASLLVAASTAEVLAVHA